MSTRRLGRYQLHERLGAGPVGEVYRATIFGVAGSAVVFAVKRIHDHVAANPDLLAALARGARVYASVDHQYVARFREIGSAEGEHYVATDWIYGMDVARLIAANRAQGTTVPMPIALTIICHAARSIAGVHAGGLMHLGVAPRNVILTPAGDVVTTDVGIFSALLSELSPRECALGERAAYVAPEQWRRLSCTLATDVWALAALCIELVSGQPAAGTSPEAAEANIISGNLARAVLPAPVASVLNRATSIDPSHRFSSAILFAEALEAAMRSAGVAATPSEIGEIVRQAQVVEAGSKPDEQSGLLTLKSLAQTTSPRLGVPGGSATSNPKPTLPGHAMARTLRPGDVPPAPQAPTVQTKGVVALKPMPTLDSLASIKTTPAERRLPPPNEKTTPIDESDLLITTHAEAAEANLFDITHQGAPRTARESVPPPPPGSSSSSSLRPVDSGRGATARSRQDLPPIPVVQRPRTETPATQLAAGDRTDVMVTPIGLDQPMDLLNLEFGDQVSLANIPVVLPSPAGTPGAPQRAPSASGVNIGGSADAPFQHQAIAPESAPPAPMPPPGTGQSSPPSQPSPLSGPRMMPRPSASASRPPPTSAALPQGKAPRRALVIATVATACVALAGLGFLAWQKYQPSADSASTVPPRLDAAIAKAVAVDAVDATVVDAVVVDAGGDAAAAVANVDATAIAVADAAVPDAALPDAAQPDAVAAEVVDAALAVVDAAPSTPPDAAIAATPLPVTGGAMPAHVSASANVKSEPAAAGQFIIESVPAAVVYVDGTNKGKTPVTLPAANDTFTVSLFAEGYALYTGKLAGTSKHKIELMRASRFGGVGGIKVRCNEKKRYYVLVDGRQTGQLCPTERLGVPIGVHTVEIVDLVGEVYRTLSVDADNPDKSTRVSID